MAEEELITIPAKWEIYYKHSAGKFGSKFFTELRDHKRIFGVRCPKCKKVLVPPRAFCDQCYVPLEEWVEVKDEGILTNFFVTYRQFFGLPKPPYVGGFVKLDGADTGLMHFIGGVDVSDPKRVKDVLKIGMRVKAVWSEERKGTILDIEYFKPI